MGRGDSRMCPLVKPIGMGLLLDGFRVAYRKVGKERQALLYPSRKSMLKDWDDTSSYRDPVGRRLKSMNGYICDCR